jgi:membrane glycosyltransferase
VALGLWFAAFAPWALIFGAPILIALIGAIPIAVFSAKPAMGRWSRRTGLFDIPEDRIPQRREAIAIHANTA